MSFGAADRGDGTQQLLGHKAIKRLKKRVIAFVQLPICTLNTLKKKVYKVLPALRTFSEFYFFFFFSIESLCWRALCLQPAVKMLSFSRIAGPVKQTHTKWNKCFWAIYLEANAFERF